MNYPRSLILLIAPSVMMILLFIILPLVTVLIQNFYVTNKIYQTVEVETCYPGFNAQICKTKNQQQPVLDKDDRAIGEKKIVGLIQEAVKE